MEGLCYSLVGMNGVSVYGKRTNIDVMSFKGRLEFFESLFVGEKLCGVAVVLTVVTAASHFYSLDSESLRLSERIVKRNVHKKVCKYA